MTISDEKPLRVHSIESFGTHDGPGIRMIVFLQGCKFKCLYCHNPDTIPFKGGLEYPVHHLMRRALRTKPYFGETGGVTVSGGEPLIQSRELLPFFRELKKEDIHTAVDTNGRVLTSATRELLDEYTDLVMLDIKHFDPKWHKKITNGIDREYSLRFAKYREESGKKMWLRYVLVPGYTDQPEFLHQMGQHFAGYKTIERLEIQPYHRLGIHKWAEMGWDYQLEDVAENSEEQLQQAYAILSQYFADVKIN